MSGTNPNDQMTQAEEIRKLQEALTWSLEENQRLKKENETLSRQMNPKQALQTMEVKNPAQEVEKLWVQNRKLSQQTQVANIRLQRVQRQYDALAESKLGRLTLNYWAWKKQNPNKGILGTVIGFLSGWMFNRLPDLRVIDLSEEEYQVLPNTETAKPALPQKSAAAGKHEDKNPDDTDSKLTEMTAQQEHWIDNYLDRIAAIPDSNGCRYYEKLPYRVGLICDEFFYESISAAADFVFLTPDNWQEELEKGLDVMLFVSAWRGLNEEWRGLTALSSININPRRQTALNLIQTCKNKGIPTVFYSKEDPPNYELFLDYARACDCIFTSARECASYYQQDCNRDHVEAVCFGINPLAHNPIGFYSREKENTVLFSGSWMKKYPDRCRELSVIFDGIVESGHGLHIIDRNYPANKNYIFPEKYFPYVSPAVPHAQLQKLHKLFDWAVNINSVKGSETMFANRAFELQANGVLLLSNFSLGVNSLLPTVQMVQDSTEVAAIIDTLTDEERYERQIAGVRSVMTGHTCFDRLASLLAPTGLHTTQPLRRILVLADALTDTVCSSFEKQTYREKELVLASTITAADLTKYDMVTWFAADAKYGEFYLEDMSNAFKYTACDYITKDAWFERGVLHSGTEHNYVSHMGSKYRTLFWRDAYSAAFLLGVSGEMDLANGYSVDHFNYDAMPVAVPEERDYLLSVIVPVYNNGAHLYGKCFASLRRSAMFRDMEIILVDDGSTDERTLKMEHYLEDSYPNVRSFRFNDSGSGSASRPRNKGVELARAPYLTFLDPDNEAVCDGYARLYQIAQDENREVVIGNMYKCDVETRLADYYGMIVKAAGTDSFDRGVGNLLAESNFMSASIQAMVIRTDLIRRNGLEQVPGAAGQDTLFSWQILHCAERIRAVDLPIHIYYAQTAGSVTNVVRPTFFRKLLLLQQPKADWLVSVGQMDEYMRRRHSYYSKNWVLKKLSLASDEDAPECATLVEQALGVFAPYYRDHDPLLDDFIALCKKKDYVNAAALTRKTFPRHRVRPMPTLEEILEKAKKPAKVQVEYTQLAGSFTFWNMSGKDGSTYAWVVLLASGTYQKVHTTKYTASPEFTYDFSGMTPNLYKVRAFLKNGEEKRSDDVAYIEVTSKGEVVLNSKQSFVVQKMKEG